MATVFDKMVEHRPSLSKFMVAGEDDNSSEDLDYRIIGDLVIKSFPWPIGVELRRLFSGSMRDLNRMRLDQIFKTIERTMQFISFIMVAQLWEEAQEKKIEIPASFKREFYNRIQILSMGNFSWLIRTIGTLFREKNIQWFMSEMAESFDSRFFDELDFWIPERNEIGHYQINLSQEEIEKRCVEYEERLANILVKIAFVVKYKLVSVREIKVKKPKTQSAVFRHVVDLLNSSDSDFQAQEIEEAKFADSNSILIMKTIKNIDEYLNLSPFLVDTNTEVLDSKEKFALKKDIFMYTKFKNDYLLYVGTEVTEKCDLRSLSTYPTLVNEFKEMLAAICGDAN